MGLRSHVNTWFLIILNVVVQRRAGNRNMQENYGKCTYIYLGSKVLPVAKKSSVRFPGMEKSGLVFGVGKAGGNIVSS